MKPLMTVITVMAVANVLAIVGLLGWLGATDRLSRERLGEVKKVFAVTVAQEAQSKEALKAAAEQEAKKAEAEKKMAEPPKTAGEAIGEQRFRDEQRAQVYLRQQQDLENFRASLLAKLANLEEREKKLAADRAEFEAEKKAAGEMEQSKQFKAALAALENQKPKDAKQMLRAMMTASQTEQVVAYLDKMEEGKRSKVLAEFVKDDAALAADLLERLRTRGTTAGGASAGHVNPSPQPTGSGDAPAAQP